MSPVGPRVPDLQAPVEAVLLLAIEHGVVGREVCRPQLHGAVAVAATHR